MKSIRPQFSPLNLVLVALLVLRAPFLFASASFSTNTLSALGSQSLRGSHGGDAGEGGSEASDASETKDGAAEGEAKKDEAKKTPEGETPAKKKYADMTDEEKTKFLIDYMSGAEETKEDKTAVKEALQKAIEEIKKDPKLSAADRDKKIVELLESTSVVNDLVGVGEAFSVNGNDAFNANVLISYIPKETLEKNKALKAFADRQLTGVMSANYDVPPPATKTADGGGERVTTPPREVKPTEVDKPAEKPKPGFFQSALSPFGLGTVGAGADAVAPLVQPLIDRAKPIVNGLVDAFNNASKPGPTHNSGQGTPAGNTPPSTPSVATTKTNPPAPENATKPDTQVAANPPSTSTSTPSVQTTGSGTSPSGSGSGTASGSASTSGLGSTVASTPSATTPSSSSSGAGTASGGSVGGSAVAGGAAGSTSGSPGGSFASGTSGSGSFTSSPSHGGFDSESGSSSGGSTGFSGTTTGLSLSGSDHVALGRTPGAINPRVISNNYASGSNDGGSGNETADSAEPPVLTSRNRTNPAGNGAGGSGAGGSGTGVVVIPSGDPAEQRPSGSFAYGPVSPATLSPNPSYSPGFWENFGAGNMGTVPTKTPSAATSNADNVKPGAQMALGLSPAVLAGGEIGQSVSAATGQPSAGAPLGATGSASPVNNGTIAAGPIAMKTISSGRSTVSVTTPGEGRQADVPERRTVMNGPGFEPSEPTTLPGSVPVPNSSTSSRAAAPVSRAARTVSTVALSPEADDEPSREVAAVDNTLPEPKEQARTSSWTALTKPAGRGATASKPDAVSPIVARALNGVVEATLTSNFASASGAYHPPANLGSKLNDVLFKSLSMPLKKEEEKPKSGLGQTPSGKQPFALNAF